MKLRQRRVYLLAYVNDIALLADKKEEMKSMMEKLERYLDAKGLELNEEKIEMMRIRKDGRLARRTWR